MCARAFRKFVSESVFDARAFRKFVSESVFDLQIQQRIKLDIILMFLLIWGYEIMSSMR
jgi:hypothetical protein